MAKDIWLVHYGVQGMHWYQHMPHVLARMKESGQRRKEASREKKAAKQEEKYRKAVNQATIKYLDSRQFSDKDLKAIIGRLQMEKQYKDLMVELGRKKRDSSRVSKLVADLAETTIKEIVNTAVKKKIKEAFDIQSGKNGKKGKKGKNGSDD